MKYKKGMKTIYRLIALSSLIGLGALLVIFCTKKTHYSFTIIYDPVYSSLSHQNINALLESSLISSLSGQRCADLKKMIPACAALRVRYRYGSKIVVQVVAMRPLMSINREHIIFENGMIYHHSLFKTCIFDTLPFITASSPGLKLLQDDSKISLHLAQISPSFFEYYSLEWDNPENLWLHDKKNNNFHIHACGDQVWSDELWHACKQLAETHVPQLIKKGTPTQSIIADIRFKNQIVITKHYLKK